MRHSMISFKSELWNDGKASYGDVGKLVKKYDDEGYLAITKIINDCLKIFSN
jgi:hypothetical protein